MEKIYTDSKEWLDNFKEKMRKDIPEQPKYRGKVLHVQTQFKFSVGEEDYFITCPSAKCGENVFSVWHDGSRIYTYKPRGNHVNKTMAERAVRLAIANQSL